MLKTQMETMFNFQYLTPVYLSLFSCFMLLFNSKVIIIKLNKESTWISYSEVGSYYSMISIINKTKFPGMACTKSMFLSTSDKTAPSTYWITAIGQSGNSARGWSNDLTSYQRPALDYKIRHFSMS